MADNSSQGGSDSIATDDIGGVKYARGKITIGADGVNEGDMASNFPLPVSPGNLTISRFTQASVSISSSGNNSVVAGTGGQTIRVFGLDLVSNGTADVRLQNGTTSNFTGNMGVRSGGTIWLPRDGDPWFTTGTGEAFVIWLSAANVSLNGSIWYTKS